MRRVGIFGRANDAQVRALAEAIGSRGGRPVVVDFGLLPRLALLHWGDAVELEDLRSELVDLDELDAIHLRPAALEHIDSAIASQVTAEGITRHHEREVARFAIQLAVANRLGRRIPVVNPADSFRHHRQKGFQHTLLLRSGIETPRVLVTNRVDRARGFVHELGGRAVAKPLASGAEVVMADDPFFEAMADAGETRPYIFQQFVRGRSYRAYLLGGAIVSMGQVHFDERYVDWRERTQRVSPAEASRGTALALSRAVRLLDLPYCGADVEYDEVTGRDYVLDLNPAALFVGWSRLTGFDMAGALGEYLLGCAARGAVAWSEEG